MQSEARLLLEVQLITFENPRSTNSKEEEEIRTRSPFFNQLPTRVVL